MQNLRDMWRAQYQVVPQQLAKVAEVHNVTTAFNTNIDAVIKLSGAKISGLADALEVTYESALGPQTQLLTPQDVMRGIVKCFVQGIAEEWLTEDKAVSVLWLMRRRWPVRKKWWCIRRHIRRHRLRVF